MYGICICICIYKTNIHADDIFGHVACTQHIHGTCATTDAQCIRFACMPGLHLMHGRDMAHARHINARHMLDTRQCHMHETLHFTVMYDRNSAHARTRSVQSGHMSFTHAHTAHAAWHLQIAMSHVCQMSDTCTTHISITLTHGHTALDICMICARHMRGTCTTFVIICTVYILACMVNTQHMHSCFSEMLTLQACVLVSLTFAIH